MENRELVYFGLLIIAVLQIGTIGMILILDNEIDWVADKLFEIEEGFSEDFEEWNNLKENASLSNLTYEAKIVRDWEKYVNETEGGFS